MRLRPHDDTLLLTAGQKLRCQRCGSWHVVFGPPTRPGSTPYERTLLWVKCHGGLYYAGSTSTPVLPGQVRIHQVPARAQMSSTTRSATAGHTRSPDEKVGERVMVAEKTPDGYRGRRGVITEISAQDETVAGYRIEFDDDEEPTTRYLFAKRITR